MIRSDKVDFRPGFSQPRILSGNYSKFAQLRLSYIMNMLNSFAQKRAPGMTFVEQLWGVSTKGSGKSLICLFLKEKIVPLRVLLGHRWGHSSYQAGHTHARRFATGWFPQSLALPSYTQDQASGQVYFLSRLFEGLIFSVHALYMLSADDWVDFYRTLRKLPKLSGYKMYRACT